MQPFNLCVAIIDVALAIFMTVGLLWAYGKDNKTKSGLIVAVLTDFFLALNIICLLYSGQIPAGG